MYLWNIHALKESIRSNGLTERAKFVYLLIWIVLFPLLGQIAFISGAQWAWTTPEIISFAAVWAIFLIGMFVAYLWNGGSKGSGFVNKFTSIGFVVSIRFLPLFIVAIIASALISIGVYDLSVDGSDFRMTWIDVVTMSVVSAWYMWRIAVHVRDVRS